MNIPLVIAFFIVWNIAVWFAGTTPEEVTKLENHLKQVWERLGSVSW